MKKGMSMFTTIILALIFLALLLYILFAPGGLLTKSAEKAFTKANESLPEEEVSSLAYIPAGGYFGKQVFLPTNKWLSTECYDVLANAVLDCFSACQKANRALFCNYVNADEIESSILVDPDLKTHVKYSQKAKDLGFDVDDLVSTVEKIRKEPFTYTTAYSTYYVHTDNPVEICCKGDKVFITQLNKCLDKAKS